MTVGKVKVIDLGKDFCDVELKVNGVSLEVRADGGSLQVMTNAPIKISVVETSTAIASAKKALEIGARMKDGTVVIAVDLKNDMALFAPEGFFGGVSDFEHQNGIIEKANSQGLHGHKDWRRITEIEARTLALHWNRVASPELRGERAPWFWGGGRVLVYSEGDTESLVFGGRRDTGHDFYKSKGSHLSNSHQVPVVRSGPALRGL